MSATTEPHAIPDESKFDAEREKLALERERLQVERYKAKWSAAAVGVPLLGLVFTAATGIWNQHRQSQLSFALKAAEIIMATDNPEATKNKALALGTLFPQHLPKEFAKSFDADAFETMEADPKRDLVTQLLAKPESAKTMIAIWKAAYPADDWILPIEAALNEKVPHSTSKK